MQLALFDDAVGRASNRDFRFYLGTHMVHWLALVDFPLFISRRRLKSRKKLPVASCSWALDSGGFSELNLHGKWVLSPPSYVAEVRRYRDAIGGLEWAAIQDWMCEPVVRKKTGLTVTDHQRLTIESYFELRELAPEIDWVPILQGWTAADYERHVDMYTDAGVDLVAEPTVGLGSICRRQGTDEAEYVVRLLAGAGISLHGFGFKTAGLLRVINYMKSADSMAWSFIARRRQIQLPGCSHRTCANCIDFAKLWRDELVLKLGMEGP